MGSVLRHASRSESHGVSSTPNPSQRSEFFSAPSSPCWQQEIGDTTLVQATSAIRNQLAPPQRSRMDHHKAMALARRKQKLQRHQQQAPDQNHNKISMSQCTLADGSTFYFVDSQHDAPQRECDSSSLTSDQRARMAQEKEKALARRKQKLQQQQQAGYQNHNKSYMSQYSQHDARVSSYCSLTSKQRARMAQEKEKALARRKHKLQQQEQQTQEQNHSNFSLSRCDWHSSLSLQAYSPVSMEKHDFLTSAQKAGMAQHKEIALARQQAKRLCRVQEDTQPLTTQSTLRRDEFLEGPVRPSQSLSQTHVHISNTQFEQHCSQKNSPRNSFPNEVQNLLEQDTVCGSTLTHEQRARMERQNAMAIARCNARVWEHQQDKDHQYRHKRQMFKEGLVPSSVTGSTLSSKEESFGVSVLALAPSGPVVGSNNTLSMCSQQASANSQQDFSRTWYKDDPEFCSQSIAVNPNRDQLVGDLQVSLDEFSQAQIDL